MRSTSGTKALTVLESLVYLNAPVILIHSACPVAFDESLVEKAALLPADWTEEPLLFSTRKIGNREIVWQIP